MNHKKILITGSSGQLGKAFYRILEGHPCDVFTMCTRECDITDFRKVRELMSVINPDIIINCAAYNLVDAAEEEDQEAYRVNSLAVRNLAEYCKEHKVFLVHFSTDYVFDGTKQDFYREEDDPRPLNVYGKSKWEGETAVGNILKNSLVFRLSWVIGDGKQNFLYKLFHWAKADHVLKIAADEVSVPTFTEDVVHGTLLSLEKGLTGVYHLTNSGYASRYELSKRFLKKIGNPRVIFPVPMSTFPSKARRPVFVAMSNEKISGLLNFMIPSWEEGLDHFVNHLKEGDYSWSV